MTDLETLLRIPYIDGESGFSISPDGANLAFAWNPGGRWQVYLLDNLLTSRFWERKVLLPKIISYSQPNSGDTPACLSPRFTPDSHSLAYAADFDGSENYHIILHPLDGLSQPHELAVAQSPAFCFLPTSIKSQPSTLNPPHNLFYLSDKTGAMQLYRLRLDGSQPELFLETDQPGFNLQGSPDGQLLALECEGPGQDNLIYIVAGDQQVDQRILARITGSQPYWLPDNSGILFCTDHEGWVQIGEYNLALDQTRWLTSGPGDKTAPACSQDGEWLAYVHGKGAQTWLVVQRSGLPGQMYQAAPGVHEFPRFTSDGRRLLFVFSNPLQPDGLWSLDLEKGTSQPLTLQAQPAIRPKPQRKPSKLLAVSKDVDKRAPRAGWPSVMPEEITYPGLDGSPVPALLYRPKFLDKNLPPAVINIHGGPTWLFRYLWYPFMSFLAEQGVLVLAPNYRGSTGYSRAWQLANRFDLGGKDAEDCAAGAHFLAESGLADPRRIAVSGRSHGGYLTMVCLTRYPELWAAGSAVVPFLNWFTSHANSRPDLQFWDRENFGDPVKDHALWYERSPYFYLERIQAPIQLISGAQDPRCPASETIQAAEELRRLGKSVDLVLYPDEGHTFLKTENLVDAEQRRTRFLLGALGRELV